MNEDIHDPQFVAQVFDNCASSYRRWSAIASFGFVARWRRMCVAQLPAPAASEPLIVDLMAGTGEIWPVLLTRHPKARKIVAIDISHQMHVHAMARLHQERSDRITHLEIDFLQNALPTAMADAVVSSFGLKTLSPAQQAIFAHELARILKPDGTFSLIEASDPKGWLLRPFYRFYLDKTLPLIERLFLNGAQDFSMLGAYTQAFGNCRALAEMLRAEGLEVTFHSDFWGCATAVSGRKPAR